jgi:hypothetical protein
MCCIECGARLKEGCCSNKWCKLYNDAVKQVLAMNQLPFGQSMNCGTITIKRRTK